MVDTGTRMYLIMEDNNRATHSVLDREDFVSNQSSLLFDTYLTGSYRHETTAAIVLQDIFISFLVYQIPF